MAENNTAKRHLLQDILLTHEDDLHCDAAAEQMTMSVSASLADDASQEVYPKLWRHLQLCPDCAAEYSMLRDMAQWEAEGSLVRPSPLRPRPGAPRDAQSLHTAVRAVLLGVLGAGGGILGYRIADSFGSSPETIAGLQIAAMAAGILIVVLLARQIVMQWEQRRSPARREMPWGEVFSTPSPPPSGRPIRSTLSMRRLSSTPVLPFLIALALISLGSLFGNPLHLRQEEVHPKFTAKIVAAATPQPGATPMVETTRKDPTSTATPAVVALSMVIQLQATHTPESDVGAPTTTPLAVIPLSSINERFYQFRIAPFSLLSGDRITRTVKVHLRDPIRENGTSTPSPDDSRDSSGIDAKPYPTYVPSSTPASAPFDNTSYEQSPQLTSPLNNSVFPEGQAPVIELNWSGNLQQPDTHYLLYVGHTLGASWVVTDATTWRTPDWLVALQPEDGFSWWVAVCRGADVGEYATQPCELVSARSDTWRFGWSR